MPQELLTVLAPSVRHEVNNLLAALSGTVDILLRTAATEREQARAARLREATDRLEALLRAYLSLAAPPEAGEGTDGGKMLALLRPLFVLALGPGRRVEIEAAPDLPRLAVTPGQLQAEMLRLVREAAEATPPGGGLRLELAAHEGGARFSAAPMPEGTAPPPLLLRSAEG